MHPLPSFQRNYRAHLVGVLCSRAYLLVVLFILTLRWFTGAPPVDVFGLFLAVLGPLPAVVVIVFMDYDPLPARYWFEGEILVAEDVSGEIRQYHRWVRLSRLGLHTLYAQTPGKTLHLPLWAYVPVQADLPDPSATPSRSGRQDEGTLR